MGSNGSLEIIIRLIVIAAAAILALPMLGRSSRPWLMRSVFLAGIAMVLASIIAPAVRAALNLPTGAWLVTAIRLDAPGFAVILLGAMRGVREFGRNRDELAVQNLELRQQASTDFLTGLLNRREAESLLEYGATRARHSGLPVGFIMIDLDHFKAVNDRHGHQAGDAVLAHVGRLLKGHLRSSDIVARYGGEEFLIVVAEPERNSIMTLAEDLRAMIERTPAEHEGRRIPLTASFGVAFSQVSTERAAREAIARADAALYAAKDQGRNRVVQWDELSPERRGEQSVSNRTLRIA